MNLFNKQSSIVLLWVAENMKTKIFIPRFLILHTHISNDSTISRYLGHAVLVLHGGVIQRLDGPRPPHEVGEHLLQGHSLAPAPVQRGHLQHAEQRHLRLAADLLA